MFQRRFIRSKLALLCLTVSSLLATTQGVAGEQFPYWSNATSEEDWKAPAECLNGGVVKGLSCQGSHCDDTALLCDPSYVVSFPEIWSDNFTDGGDNQQKRCPDGSLVTGLACAGSSCDDLSIKCSNVPSFKPQRCQWSKVKMTDGPMASLERFWFPEGYALAGLHCEGSYCDDLYAYLCTDDASDKFVPVDMYERPYFTGETWAGQKPATCDKGGAVIGLRTQGNNSSRIEFVCDNRIETTNAQKWLAGRFSEEAPNTQQTCPSGSLVSGISCDGGNCDNLKLRCVEIDGYDHSKASCTWPDMWMSDKDKGFFASFYFDEDYALAGLKCRGSQCDDMQPYLCKKPDRINSSQGENNESDGILVTESEVPADPGDTGSQQEPDPVRQTVSTFKSLDPAVSMAFMVNVIGMVEQPSDDPSSRRGGFTGARDLIEFTPPANADDRQGFERLISKIRASLENFSSWSNSLPGIWSSNLSDVIGRVKGQYEFIGPLKRIDGAYLLFVEVPEAGYLEFVSLSIDEADRILIRDLSDFFSEGSSTDNTQEQITQGDSYGGDEGFVFNTLSEVDIGDGMREIEIHADDVVRGISVVHQSGVKKTYGSDLSTKSYVLSLDPFEYITSVVVCQAEKYDDSNSDVTTKYIWYVGLGTSEGKYVANTNPFESGTIESDCKWLRPANGETVIGFYGRSTGQDITKLGIMLENK